MYSFSSSDVREDFAFFVLPVFWYHYRNGLTNRLFRGVAEHTLGTLAPACNNAIEALAYNRIVTVLDGRREKTHSRFTFPNCSFELLTLGLLR